MIYIRKRRTPEIVKKRADEIKSTPDSGYDEIELPKDAGQLRNLFNEMPKGEIREALCQEQHGLCAYCMRRIRPYHESMKIEHYKELSYYKEDALDYQNYLGVCYGGEKEDGKPHVLCCDAARGAEELTINPWDKRQMEAIAYQRNGVVYIRKDRGLDPELANQMQRDVDEKLQLNGILDKNGKVRYDTTTKLIAGRRSICDSVHTQFERWDRKKCLNVDFLQDKISKLESMLDGNNIADEYIGVRLYLYKRKQEKLRKQKKQ